MPDWIGLGVRLIGGCCRTFAHDIQLIRKAVDAYQSSSVNGTNGDWLNTYRSWVPVNIVLVSLPIILILLSYFWYNVIDCITQWHMQKIDSFCSNRKKNYRVRSFYSICSLYFYFSYCLHLRLTIIIIFIFDLEEAYILDGEKNLFDSNLKSIHFVTSIGNQM